MITLSIPEIASDATVLDAALAYAEAGWFVLPVNGSKHAGSVLGRGWPDKSSRDPKQIAAWFAGNNFGVALHVGRSGAVCLDIDHPEKALRSSERHGTWAVHSNTPGRPPTPSEAKARAGKHTYDCPEHVALAWSRSHSCPACPTVRIRAMEWQGRKTCFIGPTW